MSGRIRFGNFEADPSSGELRRGGMLVPIQDLPFRLLVALLERPGELVTRGDLTARLWGSDTFVDATAGLNTAIGKLREALEDDAEQPMFIETVPKRGYRFIGHVDSGAPPDAAASAAALVAPRHRTAALVIALAAGMVAALFTSRMIRDRPAGRPGAGDAHVRVAVVLFDNETGGTENDALAQGLTDATVAELTAESRLAVIGNAAALRTSRPFRDIAKVRDALGADYIVIGQVQLLDGDVIVRAHLIRGSDQAHVWVGMMRRTTASEGAFQADVAGQIRAALAAHALPTPTS